MILNGGALLGGEHLERNRGLTTGSQGFTLEGKFDYIVGEIQACTNCDSTLSVTAGR